MKGSSENLIITDIFQVLTRVRDITSSKSTLRWEDDGTILGPNRFIAKDIVPIDAVSDARH